jgi:hypothetical protein
MENVEAKKNIRDDAQNKTLVNKLVALWFERTGLCLKVRYKITRYYRFVICRNSNIRCKLPSKYI